MSGKELLNKSTIQEACRILSNELQPNNDPPVASPEYRRSLAVNLLYKVGTPVINYVRLVGVLNPSRFYCWDRKVEADWKTVMSYGCHIVAFVALRSVELSEQ